MKLDSILELWAKDSRIDQTDILGESLKASELHSKYYKIYVNERLVLRNLELELKQLRLNKYEFYTQGPTKETEALGWKFPSIGKILKQEANNYIDADSDVVTLTLRVGMQQEKIELLESIIKNVSNRGFQIKNYIDWARFTNGA